MKKKRHLKTGIKVILFVLLVVVLIGLLFILNIFNFKDDKGIITVSNNADISCKYYTTALTDTITNAFSVSPKVLENVKSAINICTFELTTQISDKLKKASTLLNFEDMILDITENGLKITTTNMVITSNNTILILLSILLKNIFFTY